MWSDIIIAVYIYIYVASHFVLRDSLCLIIFHTEKTIITPKYATNNTLFKFMKCYLLVIFSKLLNVFWLCYRHALAFPFLIFNKFPATYAIHLCVGYDKTKRIPLSKIRHIYIRQIFCKTHMYMCSFLV